MAKIEHTFKRYEKKFLLTVEQYEGILPRLNEWAVRDEYGLHTICNIYFDTDNYDLIRTSVKKPPYKEKFRLRSYGIPNGSDPVFAEIKKKFGGVVYKRRVAATPQEIQAFLNGGEVAHEDLQIQREIQWFLQIHHPVPKVFIGYERIAFVGKEDSDLRITFDRNIRWRTDMLDLCAGDSGQPVLDDNRIVMEVKLSHAAPLWLAALLSEFQIYPNSFSKYGTCYQRHLAADIFTRRNDYVKQYSEQSHHITDISDLSGVRNGSGGAYGTGISV